MTNCKYFGVRTSCAVRKPNCQKCADKPDCTLQTNILLATSVHKGTNVRVLPVGKVSDDILLEEV